MPAFNLEKWFDSYIEKQLGLTEEEKTAAKAFKKKLKSRGEFVGILTVFETTGNGHLRTLYIRLRAMQRVIKVKCASREEAEAACAFYEYLLFKSEIEKRAARSSMVEQKAKRVGWIETLSSLILTEKESKGFIYLQERNRLDVSIEYFALMNQQLFSSDVIDAAHAKLCKYGTYYR